MPADLSFETHEDDGERLLFLNAGEGRILVGDYLTGPDRKEKAEALGAAIVAALADPQRCSLSVVRSGDRDGDHGFFVRLTLPDGDHQLGPCLAGAGGFGGCCRLRRLYSTWLGVPVVRGLVDDEEEARAG
jgi:hypothetical protein